MKARYNIKGTLKDYNRLVTEGEVIVRAATEEELAAFAELRRRKGERCRAVPMVVGRPKKGRVLPGKDGRKRYV